MRLLFIKIGIIIIILSMIWTYSVWQFKNRAIPAKGNVVNLNAGGSHPEISFKTQEGREITYSQNDLISGYRVGNEVTVLYESSNPENASVDTFSALCGFPFLAFLMGIFFIILSLLLIKN